MGHTDYHDRRAVQGETSVDDGLDNVSSCGVHSVLSSRRTVLLVCRSAEASDPYRDIALWLTTEGNGPRKIRDLVHDLERAGFINKGGKGSHRNYRHSKGARVTISGNLGDDAKPYQEKEVSRKIEESQR